MKQYRTRFLKGVALIYLGFPLLYLFISAVLFDIPLYKYVSILLSPFYYFLSAWVVAAGWGIWEMRRWAWYVFTVANLLILYENAVLIVNHGETHHKFVSYMMMVGAIAILFYRVTRELKVPYYLPKIRWWESGSRYQMTVPSSLQRETGERLEGEIMDISAGGCFIKLAHDLEQDESLELKFNVFGNLIECQGRVVWRTHSTVTHPRGVGVKFENLSKQGKQKLRVATRRLKRVSKMYRNSLSEQD